MLVACARVIEGRPKGTNISSHTCQPMQNPCQLCSLLHKSAYVNPCNNRANSSRYHRPRPVSTFVKTRVNKGVGGGVDMCCTFVVAT